MANATSRCWMTHSTGDHQSLELLHDSSRFRRDVSRWSEDVDDGGILRSLFRKQVASRKQTRHRPITPIIHGSHCLSFHGWGRRLLNQVCANLVPTAGQFQGRPASLDWRTRSIPSTATLNGWCFQYPAAHLDSNRSTRPRPVRS